MKKIYALAAAALMATGAMAQNGAPLYATGGGGFDPQWAPGEPAEFEYVNGEYVLELQGCDGLKISTAMGSWDEFNAGAIGVAKVETPETWTPIAPFGENTQLPWKGDYTVKVKGDLSAIWVSTTTPAPEGPDFLCFRGGNMNDWNNDLGAWGFLNSKGEKEYTGVGVYSFTCGEGQYAAANEGFKIALSRTWDTLNIGGDGTSLVPLDEEYPLESFTSSGGPGHIKLAKEWNGVCYLDVQEEEMVNDAGETYTASVVTVLFSNDKDYENPFSGVKTITVDNNVAPVYYNLQGVRVAQPENGLYIVVKGGKSYKVAK